MLDPLKPVMRRALLWAVVLVNASCGEYATLPRAVTLAVEPSNVTLNIGEAQLLSASRLDENGNVLVDGLAYTWRSVNPAIATVTATGRVTAIAPGSTEIVASAGGLQGASNITVRIPAPARVAIDPPTASIARGDSLVLTPRALATDGSRYEGRDFTWQNSNPTVVSLTPTSDGRSARLVAIAPGSATLSATNLGVSGTLAVVVLPDPVISFASGSVSFVAQVGGSDPQAQSVRIGNAGGGALRNVVVRRVDYGAGQPGGWLQASIASAGTPQDLELRASVRGLSAGPYSASVVVGSTQPAVADVSVNVTLSVTPPPALTLSATSLTFAAPAGGATPPVQTIDITNTGGGTLSGLTVSAPTSAGQAAPWLTATLTSTTEPSQVRVQVNQAGLAPGTYTASFTVAAAGAASSPRTVTVTLNLVTNAAIRLSQNQLTILAPLGGGAQSRTIQVSNGGGGTLSGLSLGPVTYGAGQPTGWLLGQLSAVQAPADISITAPQTALAPGTYTASFEVRSSLAGVAPAVVTVTLTVAQAGVITATPATVQLNSPNGLNPTPVNVAISNTGGGNLTGLVATISYPAGQPAGWLSTSFAGLVTSAPATLVVQAQVGALSVGTYTATITLSSPDAPATRTIPVTLTIPATFFVASSVALTGTQGVATTLTNSTLIGSSSTRPIAGLTLSVTYAVPGSTWLNATLSQNTTNATLNLSSSVTAGLPRATDQATVRISGTGVPPVDITVTRQLVYTFSQHIGPGYFTSGGCTGCHSASSFTYAFLTTTNTTGNPALRYLNAGSTNTSIAYLYLKLTQFLGGRNHTGDKSQADKDRLRDMILDGTRP